MKKDETDLNDRFLKLDKVSLKACNQTIDASQSTVGRVKPLFKRLLLS